MELSPPRSTMPAWIGGLAIGIGCVGMLCTGWMNLGTALMPLQRSQMQAEQARQDSLREARQREFEEELAAAEDEEARKEIQQRYDRWLQSRSPVDVMKMFEIMDDSRLVGYAVAVMALSLVTNSMLIAAGIGLIRERPWGRRLALTTAGVKLAFLLCGLAYALAVAVPIQAEAVSAMMEPGFEAQRQQPGPPMPDVIGAGMFEIVYYGMAIGTAVAAAVFPIVLLFVLNTGSAKRRFAKP